MNNKAINEFGFRSIHRIKQIEEGVIHRSQNRLKHIWRNKGRCIHIHTDVA